MKRGFCFALLFLLWAVALPVAPNPQGGVVSAGQAVISNPSSSTTLIHQSTPKAIINWQTFNIQRGQTTQFIQPGASSITLNRINGLNGPSSIFGNLIANGQVWLINPAGIVFGKGAQVNVGGLVATTANIRDEDFLSGNYKFTSEGQFPNASIINRGTIRAHRGGLVALIGNKVQNTGKIEAKLGTVVLAGAKAYTLDFDGDQLINFVVHKDSSDTNDATKNIVSNSGVIDTGASTMTTHSAAKKLIHNAINLSGFPEANHASTKGGVIILAAGGGNAEVKGTMIAAKSIQVTANNIKVKNAKMLSGRGQMAGNIALLSANELLVMHSKLDASSLNKGGKITLLGKDIKVINSQLTANGLHGGGEILIGGNAYGKGPEPNALTTFIDKDTRISADAIDNGNGGKIVAWADGDTIVNGSLSAKGGLLGGDGGWIETSGKNYLDVTGIGINLLAPMGKTGTWLLDPSNVTISNSASANINLAGGVYTPTAGATTSTILASALVTALNSSNIEVVTTSSGGSAGNITIATPITWSSGNTLTLTADPSTGTVFVNSAIQANGSGAGLVLSGNAITISAAITTNNGAVSFTGNTSIGINNAVSTGSGQQTYNSPLTLTTSTVLTGGPMTFSSIALGANTLTVNTSFASSTVSGAITGTGGLTTTGTGTLNLAVSNSYSGTTTLGAGSSIIASNTGSLGSGPISIGGSGAFLTLEFNGGTLGNTNTITFSGTGANSGSLISSSTSTNTISNPITLTAGGSPTIGTNNTGGFTLNGNISNSTANLTLDSNSGTITIGGVIGNGSGSLTKTGSGIVTLSNTNTYTGTTSIFTGTLNASVVGALGSNTISIGTGSTLGLTFNGGTLGNTNTITIAGSGILNSTSTSTNTINNPITLSAAGTPTISTSSTGGLTLNGNISNSTAALTFTSGTGTINVAGVIGNGTGSLTKSGSGILTLSNANTYSGATNINAGSLTLGAANGIGSSSAVILANVSGAVFNLNGFNDTIGSLAGGGLVGGNVSMGAGNLTAGGDNTSTTFSGSISSTTGGFTKAGTGTLTLAASSNYSGGTSVNAGTLRLNHANAIGSGSTTVASGATLALNFATATLTNTNTITLNGSGVSGAGALQGLTSTDTLSNDIILGSNTTVGGTGNLILNGIISDGGSNFSLSKTGANNITLTATNTYGGSTTINAGTLTISKTTALGSTGDIFISGGTIILNIGGNTLGNTNTITFSGGNLTNNATSGQTTILTNAIVLNSTPNITASNSNATLRLSGNISGDISGGLVTLGNGIIILSGNNSYNGVTSIDSGTLRLEHVNALGSSSSTSVASGATLALNFATATLGNTNPITLNGTGVSGAGALQGLTNTYTLSNNISLGSNTTVGGTGNLILNGGISDGGFNFNFTKAGTNTITLGAFNAYGGATSVNAGTLILGHANALGSSSGTTIANGATLALNFATATLGNTNNITLNGTGVGGAGALQGLTSTDTLSNNIILGSNTTIGGTGNLILNGILSDGGSNFSLTKAGTNTISLGGSNTYGGATSINAGTLSLGHTNALGSSSGTTVATGATLALNFATATLGNTNNITLNGTGVGGAGALQGLTSTDTLSNNIILGSNTTVGGTGNLILNGIISDGGSNFSLTKAGTNTIILGGSNTYGGATAVNAGTLNLGHANALGSSSGTTVASGATLALNFATATLGNTNNITLNGTGVGGAGALQGLTSTDTLSNNIILGSNTTVGGTGNLIINGIISDGGSNFSFTKAGANTITLAGSNTFGGGTTVNSGTLSASNPNSLGTTGAINLAGGTLALNLGGNALANASTLSFNGGALTDSTAAGTSDTLTNDIVLNSTAIITASNANATLALSGGISGAGGISKAGNGSLSLSGNNSYNGATAVNAGTLNLGHANALGSSSSTSVASGATLALNFATATLGNTNDITLNGTGIGGAGALQGLTSTDTLSNNIILGSNTTVGGTGNLILNGIISDGGSNFSFTKAGANTITLAGSNTFGGGTTVNSGTLSASNPNSLGTTGAINLAGGTLALNLGGNALANASTLSFNGGALTDSTAAGTTDTLTNDIVLNSTAIITASNANATLALSGGISGAGGISKAGNGSLSLSGNNSYNGATAVNAGTLNLGHANALGSSSSTSVASGATLALNFATATLGNTNDITLNGTGVGGAGALQSLTSTDTLSNNIILGSNTTVGGTGNLILNGIISDGGSNFSLTKAGTNTISLGGSNTYGGATSINAGTLSLGHTNALGSSSGTTVASGATLALNFATATLGNTNDITLNGTGVGGAGALQGLTSTDTLSNNIILGSNTTVGGTGNLILNGIISDGGSNFSFTKAGTNTITLGGSNTYGGATAVNTGTISLSHANALGSSSSTTVASGATLALNFATATLGNTNSITLNGTGVGGAGALQGLTSTDTLSNNIILGSNTTVGGTGNLILNGIISDGGSNFSFTKAGANTITLAGSNTFGGGTTVNSGTLSASNPNSLGTTGAINLAGGTLALNLGGNTLANASTLSFNGGALTDSTAAGTSDTLTNDIVLNSTAIITASNANATLALSGGISGAGGISKAGNGSLSLSGNNSYNGATAVNAGTLNLGHANALGSSSSTSVASGATLALNFATATLGNTNDITLNGTGVGGAGALQGLTSTDTLSNNIILGSNTTVGGTGNLILNGIISDGGSNFSFTKAGANTITLAGSNTFGGGTTVNSGTLSASNPNSLGTTGAINLAGGTLALNLGGNALANASTLSFNGGALTDSTAAGTSDTLTNAIVLNSTAIITASNANATLALSGGISGAGGISKAGNGSLSLSGNNSYNGATAVNAGTLNLGHANALGSSSSTSVASGATLALNFASATLGNTNDITLNGTGVGGAGALQGLTSTDTLSNNIILGSNTTVGGTGNLILNGIISDGGSNFSFTKAGANTITLAGSNTFGGGTTVNSGTLSASNPNSLGTTGAINLAGGTLALNLGGNALANASTLSFNGGALTGSTAAGTTDTLNNNIILNSTPVITSSNANATLAFAGDLSGTGGINKAGNGILALSGNNSYTGVTNINSGTVNVTHIAGLGDTGGGAISLATGTTLSLNLSGGTLTNPNAILMDGTATLADNAFAFNSDSINNPIILAAGSTPTISSNNANAVFNLAGDIMNNNANLSFNSVGNINVTGIIGNGTGGISKNGAGTLTLSNANTYTGATNINAGTLQLGADNGIGSGSAVTNNGVFDLAGFNLIIGSLAGTGNVHLGAGNLTAGGNNSSTSYSGVIDGSGNFTKAGTGTMTLGAANTYTGATTISAGTLQLGANNGIGSGSAVTNNGIFDLAGFNDTIGSLAGTGDVHLGSGNLSAGGNNTSTSYSGVIDGSGSFTKAGTGTMTLGAANTYTGATNISAGTLQLAVDNGIGSGSALTNNGIFDLAGFNDTIGSLAGSGNVHLGSGNLTAGGNNSSTSYSGVIDGTGAFTKAGTGTMILGAANTYTGATTISAGTLQLGANNGIGSSSALTNNGVFDLAGFNDTIGSLAGSGNVHLGSGNLSAGGNNTSTSYSGVIDGTGAFTKTGTGTMTLAGVNTYSGATNINNGSLRLGIDNAISSDSAVNLANVSGANFNMNGFNDTIGSLAGGGTTGGDVILSGNLTTGGNDSSTTYAGSISGTGNFTKAGNGIMSLAGSNSYTGSTNVDSGSLYLSNANALGSGATQSSSIDVLSGATLAANFTAGSTLANTQAISLSGTGVGGAGALQGLVSTNTLSNDLNLAGNTRIGGSGDLNLTGAISGNFSLTKVGSNTITLAGSNTFNGGTTVNSGTLDVSNQNALGPSGNIQLSGGTLSLALGGNTLQNQSPITFNGGSLSSNNAAGLTDILMNAISLSSSATIDIINAGSNLSLGGTMNGPFDLLIAGAGNIILDNSIGNLNPLNSLNILTSNTMMNSGSISTIGNQTYAGAMTLVSDLSLQAQTGNLTFNGTVDGAQNLTLASLGNLTFNSDLGATTRLGNITVNQVNNATTTALINALSFNQPAAAGSNITHYGGINALGNISIVANQLSGDFYTPGTLSLTGISSLTGFINLAANLIVNGQNGGTLFGLVTGTASLGAGAQGLFYLNGVLIGGSIPPTPIPPSPTPTPIPDINGVAGSGVYGNIYSQQGANFNNGTNNTTDSKASIEITGFDNSTFGNITVDSGTNLSIDSTSSSILGNNFLILGDFSTPITISLDLIANITDLINNASNILINAQYDGTLFGAVTETAKSSASTVDLNNKDLLQNILDLPKAMTDAPKICN